MTCRRVGSSACGALDLAIFARRLSGSRARVEAHAARSSLFGRDFERDFEFLIVAERNRCRCQHGAPAHVQRCDFIPAGEQKKRASCLAFRSQHIFHLPAAHPLARYPYGLVFLIFPATSDDVDDETGVGAIGIGRRRLGRDDRDGGRAGAPVVAPVVPVVPVVEPVVVAVVPVVVPGMTVVPVPLPVPVVRSSCDLARVLYFFFAIISHFLRLALDLSFLHSLSAMASFPAWCLLPVLAPAG